MFKKIPRNPPKNATGLLLFLLRRGKMLEYFSQDSKAPEEGLDIMVATVRIVATNPVIAFTLITFKTLIFKCHKIFVTATHQVAATSVENAPISRATKSCSGISFYPLAMFVFDSKILCLELLDGYTTLASCLQGLPCLCHLQKFLESMIASIAFASRSQRQELHHWQQAWKLNRKKQWVAQIRRRRQRLLRFLGHAPTTTCDRKNTKTAWIFSSSACNMYVFELRVALFILRN